ncbi:MAG: hypothetical protein JWQ33_2993 [Ramlibacter sp.]|nr:hypothetical protein [Ramlibacter sp.]
MKLLRVISLAAALLPALACAQWQWIDKDGHKVFSDRSPPADIPAKNILKQPGGKPAPVPAEAEASADAAAAADAAAKAAAQGSRTAANMPKISGKDKALEDKKKQAEEEAEAKKKAEDDKLAQAKAENCERAKRSLQSMTSGVRIRAPNAKGEMEFMSDEQRAAETKRLQGITADCKG